MGERLLQRSESVSDKAWAWISWIQGSSFLVGLRHFLFQLRQHLEHPVTNQVAIGPNLYYQPGSWYDLEWFSFTVSTSAGSAESLRTGCCTVAGTGSTTQAIGANRRGECSDARPTSEKIMRNVDGEGDAQGAA